MEQATRPVATILPSTFDTLYQYNVGGRSTIKSSMSPEPTIILPDMDFSSDKIWNLPITTTAPSSRSSLTTDSGGSSGCEDFESMLVAAPMDMTHSYPNQSSIPKDNSSHSWHLVDWMSNNQSPKPRRRAARSETDAERLEVSLMINLLVLILIANRNEENKTDQHSKLIVDAEMSCCKKRNERFNVYVRNLQMREV